MPESIDVTGHPSAGVRTALALIAQGHPWHDVKAYGAVGDGSTDDTAAFNSVIAAVNATTGGARVNVPPGVYKITSALTPFTRPVVLIGAGCGQTLPRAGTELLFSATVPGITLGANSEGSKIDGIYLKSSSTALGTDDGLTLTSGRHEISNVVVDGFGRYGISIDSSPVGVNCNLSQFSRVLARNSKSHGVFMKGGDSNLIKFHGLSVVGNAGWGVRIEGGGTNLFTAPHSDSNTAGAFYDGGGSNTWVDVYAESSGTFEIATGSSYGTLLCGHFGLPNVVADSSAIVSWTVLSDGQWRRNLYLGPLPADPNQTSYRFALGSPNNGSLSLNNSTPQRIFDVDGGATRLALALKLFAEGEVEIDGALNHDGSTVGFYGTAPIAKPTVTGAKGGNAALGSLLTALANLGLITDSTTA